MTQIKIIPETISTAAERMRSRVLSPVELTASCLERIGRLQPQFNAWITVAAESALGAARTAEKQIEGGDWKALFTAFQSGRVLDNLRIETFRTVTRAAYNHELRTRPGCRLAICSATAPRGYSPKGQSFRL